ncbi:MAG: hypothetical protein L0I76_29535 [Pseudonocardia sp.]|nr:hypothetical protein [Pseudonocardia sp.]
MLRAILAAALGLAVLTGCGTADAEPAPAPVRVTVTSVEAGSNMTLSAGDSRYKVYDTALGIDANEPGSCEAKFATGVLRQLLVGREVVEVKVHEQWAGDSSVLPGYRPAALRFAGGDNRYGDDLSDEYRAAYGQGYAHACPNLERAPLSGREVADTPGDTYVDVNRDGGESRFCSRRFWC